VFCRLLLSRMGYDRRWLLPKLAPPGCAKQWVRQQWPVEVEAQRKRHAASVLLAAIDADNLSPAREKANREAELSLPRSPDEKIALFIPKWCIETWLQWLGGDHGVTEEEQHPATPEDLRDACRAAVEQYLQMAREGRDTGGALPALDMSFPEYNRLRRP